MPNMREQIMDIVNSSTDSLKYRELLLSLLAIVHRDGGQHTENVGIEQSVEDALQIVSDSHQ